MINFAAPALPLDQAGKYVAAAYVVFLTLLLVYIAIIGVKLARIERELEVLTDLADKGNEGTEDSVTVEANGDQG